MSEGVAAPAENGESRPWRTLVHSRWFAWFHLACAGAAGASWYLSDGRAGPWPLLLAGLPWMTRLVSGHSPLPRTRYDPLILGFLLSAIIGAWAGYDRALAWEKFWLIVGGITLFYALAGQRTVNLWPILMGMALFGSLLGLYFMLTHDWISIPAKIETLNRIGLQLMESRPAAFGRLHRLHPNVAGGIMAMMSPFGLAIILRGIKKRRLLLIIFGIIALGMMLVGLAFTTSRGAWIALMGGLLAWLLWVGAGRVADSLYLTRRKTMGLGLLLVIGFALSMMLIVPSGLNELLDRLPGPPSAGSRLDIVRDSADLVGDFWLIGSGLASFEGIYSQYIQIIPYYVLYHSHNFYLDVTIEQGFVGLVLLVSTIFVSFWWLSDPYRSDYRRSTRGYSLFCGATFAALVIMCLHGLVDDPLYGSRGVLLLWLPVGLTAFLFPERKGWIKRAREVEISTLITFGILAILAAALLMIYRLPILSVWESNMGAVEMSRVELAGFPSGEWSDGQELPDLVSARHHFELALLFDRDNRTAWYRLGLIAMLGRDYEAAADALYNAHLLDGDHRGIRKNLAYAYVWAGYPERALPLLRDIPEADQELATYRGWWIEQGYPLFSDRAVDTLRLLNEHPVP